jgi:MAF protein
MKTSFTPSTKPLVLASSSPFRRSILARLGLEFITDAPQIDETPSPDEDPESLVIRLAKQKAMAISIGHPDSLIIGSDQVAAINHQVLGKPGNHDRAIKQLSMASGKKVTFYTGLCLLNSKTDNMQVCCEPFHVHFRTLDSETIENYLQRERPYNCAGSFKSEGLGIVLFEKLEGADPNALIGLPLIRLIDMLKEEGIDPLTA